MLKKITKQKIQQTLSQPKHENPIDDKHIEVAPLPPVNQIVEDPYKSKTLMPIINSLMDNILKQNVKQLKLEKIEPISDEVHFGLNGIWLFIGRQGSGKSYKIMQIILYTELLHRDKPLFNNIIFCSTSNENDKTIDAFKNHVRTRIEYVAPEDLIKRMEQHIKRKKKFYAIMTYIQSKGKIVPKAMKKMALKHKLFDTKKTAIFIQKKFYNWGNPTYPAFCLLIMDDMMGNTDLERKENPLVKMLTKCRHYNITCIISQQSTKGIGRPTRRLASDACIWAGFGFQDFIDIAREMSNNENPKLLYEELYKDLTGHDFMAFHSHLNEVIVEKVE